MQKTLMFDLRTSIQTASAQSLIAALMLLHPQKSLMERILFDLAAHPQLWKSFVLAPTLPPTEEAAYLGILACLRDLAFGWTADTLYILAPDSGAAEQVRSLSIHWQCSESTLYSSERTEYLTLTTGILVALRWRTASAEFEERDYDQLYRANANIRFDVSRSLCHSSAQSLVTALVRRGQFGKFDPQQVLGDLKKHRVRWRSFLLGPPLPESGVNLQHCLETLTYLPPDWGGNCLYLWAWNMVEAMLLQSLHQKWQCTDVAVFTVAESSRLLDLAEAAPVVMYVWDDVGWGCSSNSLIP